MGSTFPPARLFLVGGRSGRARDEGTVLAALARLAGEGGPARVVVASFAGRGEATRAAFAGLDIADFRLFEVGDREGLDHARTLAAVERATAVVFDGDDPRRIAGLVRDTRLDAAIRRRLGDGLIVVGLGPAAAALAGRMLVDDVIDPDHGPGPEVTEPITGLGYLPGAVLDPFFGCDDLTDRLVSALAEGPDDLGLGVDDATALSIGRGLLEVVGPGGAAVVDASRADGPAIRHALGPGDRFDLAARSPVGKTGEF